MTSTTCNDTSFPVDAQFTITGRTDFYENGNTYNPDGKWLPSLSVAIFMILFLGFSFMEYHKRFVMKRRSQNEYLEYQLAKKRPKIATPLCFTHANDLLDLAQSLGSAQLRFLRPFMRTSTSTTSEENGGNHSNHINKVNYQQHFNNGYLHDNEISQDQTGKHGSFVRNTIHTKGTRHQRWEDNKNTIMGKKYISWASELNRTQEETLFPGSDRTYYQEIGNQLNTYYEDAGLPIPNSNPSRVKSKNSKENNLQQTIQHGLLRNVSKPQVNTAFNRNITHYSPRKLPRLDDEHWKYAGEQTGCRNCNGLSFPVSHSGTRTLGQQYEYDLLVNDIKWTKSRQVLLPSNLQLCNTVIRKPVHQSADLTDKQEGRSSTYDVTKGRLTRMSRQRQNIFWLNLDNVTQTTV